MVNFTLRLPDELYAAIREAAGNDRRSITAEMLHLLELGLQREDERWH